jgi:hypothetical protein
MRPDFSHLIGKIREAERASDAWPDTLTSLTDTLGVAGAACIISNKETGRVDWVCFSGLSADLQSDYVNHYAPLDPFTPLLNVDLGWTRLSECFSDSVLRKSEWYNDFLLSCGVRDILGARLVETPSHFVTFGLHQRLGRHFADKTAAIVERVAGALGSATLRHIERLAVTKRGKLEPEVLSGGTRFYFHVKNGTQYPDATGKAFVSRREAVAHAAVLAAELAQDGDWYGFVVSVTDACGRVVAEIPVHK